MSSIDNTQKDDTWKNMASSYEIILKEWEPYKQLIEKAAEHLSSAEIILDNSCGTGILADKLARSGGSCTTIFGMDIEPAMLASAIEKEKSLRKDEKCGCNITLGVGDAQDLIFSDESVDGVASINVLYNVEHPKKLLSEAFRVLKYQGVFVVTGPKPDTNMEFLGMKMVEEFKEKGIFEKLQPHLKNFMEMQTRLSQTGFLNLYTAEQVVSMLKEIGFSTVIESTDNMYHGNCFLVAMQK